MVKLPAPDELRFDKRTKDRYKNLGRLKDKEIDDNLRSLPDEAGNAEKVAVWEAHIPLPSQRLRSRPQQSAPVSRNIQEEAEELPAEESLEDLPREAVSE